MLTCSTIITIIEIHEFMIMKGDDGATKKLYSSKDDSLCSCKTHCPPNESMKIQSDGHAYKLTNIINS